jgi:hypothetical protein
MLPTSTGSYSCAVSSLQRPGTNVKPYGYCASAGALPWTQFGIGRFFEVGRAAADLAAQAFAGPFAIGSRVAPVDRYDGAIMASSSTRWDALSRPCARSTAIFCTEDGEIGPILRTIEEGFLGDKLVAAEIMSVHRTEFGVYSRSPGFRERQGAEMGEYIDANWCDAELDDELRVEEGVKRYVARGRTAEEVGKSFDASLRIGSRGRDEQIQVFRSSRASMQRERVGASDDVAHLSRV